MSTRKAAWGGTSWDNQALFDINGYPIAVIEVLQRFCIQRKRTDHSIEDR